MRSKYRIAYLVTPIEFGGSEKVSLNFLLNVDRELFKICPILFFRPWEGDTFFLKEIEKAGFSAYNIPVSLGNNDYMWLVRRYRKLFSFLRHNHFDLLHTHGYVADILGISSASILRIPVISTCHGFIENDRKLSLYNRLDRFFLRFSDEIVAVSKNIRANLISGGIKPSNIKVIPNAVGKKIDPSSSSDHRQVIRKRFAFSETDFVIGYVGRLSQEKGLTYLIEAVSLARNANYPVKLLIIGAGPQEPELQKIIRTRGLEPYVIFAGFQNDIDQFLHSIDVFVLPSLTEGTPMALLEAMAWGIPSIASAVGQIPEMIDSGKSGILVTPGDAQEICDYIVFLYGNPFIRKSISKTAQKKIRDEFDINAWVKKIETEYINLIKNRIGP